MLSRLEYPAMAMRYGVMSISSTGMIHNLIQTMMDWRKLILIISI